MTPTLEVWENMTHITMNWFLVWERWLFYSKRPSPVACVTHVGYVGGCWGKDGSWHSTFRGEGSSPAPLCISGPSMTPFLLTNIKMPLWCVKIALLSFWWSNGDLHLWVSRGIPWICVGVLGSGSQAVFASRPRAPTLPLLPPPALPCCLRSFPRQSLHPSTQCPATRATEVM